MMIYTKAHYTRLAIDTIAYCCLLLVSYGLVTGVYQEYQESKTNFSITKEPVTVKDNPAILVKFTNVPELRYGIDYVIEVSTWSDVDSIYIKDPGYAVNVGRDRLNNANRTTENCVEVRALKTTNPDVQLLLISPSKTDLIQNGQYGNVWKMFHFLWISSMDPPVVSDANMVIGFTSMVKIFNHNCFLN